MNRATKYAHWSPDAQRVLGFFVAKGFLLVQGIKPMPSLKLDLETVLQLGLELEPRILEVLPAALLHFPRTFRGQEKMPKKLRTILDAIRHGDRTGPDLGGIPYTDLLRWADHKILDGRIVPIAQQRTMKSLRLSRKALAKLKEKAQESGQSETAIVESLILNL